MLFVPMLPYHSGPSTTNKFINVRCMLKHDTSWLALAKSSSFSPLSTTIKCSTLADQWPIPALQYWLSPISGSHKGCSPSALNAQNLFFLGRKHKKVWKQIISSFPNPSQNVSTTTTCKKTGSLQSRIALPKFACPDICARYVRHRSTSGIHFFFFFPLTSVEHQQFTRIELHKKESKPRAAVI